MHLPQSMKGNVRLNKNQHLRPSHLCDILLTLAFAELFILKRGGGRLLAICLYQQNPYIYSNQKQLLVGRERKRLSWLHRHWKYNSSTLRQKPVKYKVQKRSIREQRHNNLNIRQHLPNVHSYFLSIRASPMCMF